LKEADVSPGFKRFLLVVGGLSLAATVCLGGILLWIERQGVLTVQVQERDGTDIRICCPAALARLLLDCAPGCCVESAECRLRTYRPLMTRLCQEMRNSPDFTMVETSEAHQAVRVCKQGRDLLVEVQSPEEHVHLSIPFPLVNSIMARI